MVTRYTKKIKIIKESTDDTAYISLIDSNTMKSIKEFRTAIKDIAKLIMNNKFILDFTDSKLHDVAFDCDLGPNCEWFNLYCEDAWDLFKEYCSENYIDIDDVRGSNSKFYLTDEDDYITKYVRDNAYDSSNIDIDELEELISMAYGEHILSYPYNDIYEYLMSGSKLEEYLHDNYLQWGTDANYENLQEFVSDLISNFDTDFETDLASAKTAINNTIEAYEYIQDFKDNQVEDYNSWLEDNKEYNSEYFND